MAKTLIGNIKGKNGRGITSIKKTGTDGSIDTYTITYTDDTTSTFTINNSDSISLQRQIVPSAAVESSATASQAYAAGDYVVVNGVLRKVTAAIAKGNAISDSNSAITTVTDELANSVSRIQLTVTDVKSGFTVKAWKTALGIQIHVEGSSNTLIQSAEEWSYEVAKIPAAASLTLCGLVGMMWTEGANSNDLMWFHMSDGSLRVDFKSKTKDWPKTIHCDGIMAYS